MQIASFIFFQCYEMIFEMTSSAALIILTLFCAPCSHFRKLFNFVTAKSRRSHRANHKERKRMEVQIRRFNVVFIGTNELYRAKP